MCQEGMTSPWRPGSPSGAEHVLDEALLVLPRQKRHRVLLVLAQRQDVLCCAAVARPPAAGVIHLQRTHGMLDLCYCESLLLLRANRQRCSVAPAFSDWGSSQRPYHQTLTIEQGYCCSVL